MTHKYILISLLLLFFLSVPAYGQEQEALFSSHGLTLDAEDRYTVRGQLSPVQHTIISSEIAANILELSLREGDPFSEGERLAKLDCSAYLAQKEKAEAAAMASRKILEVNKRLDNLNINSIIDLEQSEGKALEAEALVNIMNVTMEKCDIKAPFSGHVVERYVQPHQYVKPGDPLLRIINPDLLEIRLIVPSQWLTWLNQGTLFQFFVEENNRTFPARVIRIGPEIDPISQSIPVMAEIAGAHPGLLPGMSGYATFSPEGEAPVP